MCIINPVMGMINSGLGNGLTYIETTWGGIIVGCIVAGMMAVDMGGPFNKAAYLFGTGLLTGGASSKVMAAVMIGGMVPPIAIALATTFFKKKFTADERKSGFVNYIMGLCFITEGAIPFAASDPLRVIPACVVGSAVAGGISEAFGCSIRAPHGGVFVFALVEHPLGYIAALVVGSLVGDDRVRLHMRETVVEQLDGVVPHVDRVEHDGDELQAVLLRARDEAAAGGIRVARLDAVRTAVEPEHLVLVAQVV